ncbi:hypothetical protein AB0F11_30025 [Streptomyces sp. NPDC032472]|uniref:hypothetical protein n=1 Tax=Streptomyces sp. NPDC032472 TaxID=3155018 RepID=UPI0033F39B95
MTDDPGNQRAVGAALVRDASEAGDMLLVYYAGHGLLDDDGRLYLARTGTDPARPGFTSVPLELVQRDLARARAGARITAALLDALAQEEPLTLDGIYRQVDRELAGLGLPRPQRRSVNAVGDEYVLVRWATSTSASSATSAPASTA